MMLKIILFGLVAFAMANSVASASSDDDTSPTASATAKRVILFGIDGLAAAAPERIAMPTFNALAKQGVRIREMFVAPPWHPTIGPWGDLQTTSYPNVVQLTGTLFIKPDTRYVQEIWFPPQLGRGEPVGITAHATNSTAYASLNRGFNHSFMQRGPDRAVIDWSIALLQSTDVKFMRIHLQNTGEAGRVESADQIKDVPWRHNIWAENSPYRRAAEAADSELARLIDALKANGKWDDTVLIVTSDHGQADHGWHAPMSEASWSTPFLIAGPGIARGRTLSYGEQTDIVPTIAAVLHVAAPNQGPGAGRIMREVFTQGEIVEVPHRLETINRQMREYMLLEAQMRLASAKRPSLDDVLMQAQNTGLTDRQFYGLDRFLEWYRAGSIDKLIENNRLVLNDLRTKYNAAERPWQ